MGKVLQFRGRDINPSTNPPPNTPVAARMNVPPKQEQVDTVVRTLNRIDNLINELKKDSAHDNNTTSTTVRTAIDLEEANRAYLEKMQRKMDELRRQNNTQVFRSYSLDRSINRNKSKPDPK